LVFYETLVSIPLAFLILAPAFRSMDPAFEEAALTSGVRPASVLRRVTAPLLLPSLLSVVFLTLIQGLEAFEGPAILGVPAGLVVLSVEIYSEMNLSGRPRYGLACAFSVVLIVLVLLALIPYYRATRHAQRFTTITGKGFRP